MVKQTLEDMKELAILRGGRCLSKEYRGVDAALTWRCQKGHTFEMTPSIVKQGGWCMQCAKDEYKAEMLELLNGLAQKKGGRCVSEQYLGNVTKLKWECREGHQWMTAPREIKSGYWCPYCSGVAKPTMDDMRALAKSRGGKCLSAKYVNNRTQMLWECAKGHRWKAQPHGVRRGTWCPTCGFERGAKKNRLTIEAMQQLARDHEGRCISPEYINIDTNLRWKCAKRHVWEASPYYIKKGHWCPRCTKQELRAKQQQAWLKELREVAKAMGGKCLSAKYAYSDSKMRWQCANGHQFKMKPIEVLGGHWCKYCRRKTIEDMRLLALKQGGKCLSKRYVNTLTPLRWQCAKGHRWKTLYIVIQRGGWCPKCYLERRWGKKQ